MGRKPALGTPEGRDRSKGPQAGMSLSCSRKTWVERRDKKVFNRNMIAGEVRGRAYGVGPGWPW